MEEHLFLSQTDGADCQSHAGQKIESLRYHADHRGDHGGDAVPETVMLEEKRLGKEHKPDGYNRNTHAFHQLVQGPDHLRLLALLHLFRL